MNETYRSIRVVKHFDGKPLEFPICVPTYGRPDNAMVKVWRADKRLPVIFFIRKEQKELYRPLKNEGAKIVLLTHSYCAGSTRREICEWGRNHGYKHIFMFDDRVTRVSMLAPKISRTGRLSLGTVSEYRSTYHGMLLWEYLIKKYDPIISGGAHSGFTFDPGNIGLAPKFFGVDCQIAIHLNLEMLAEHGIAYRDTKDCGSDDAAINFDCLSRGLPYMVFSDLEYDCIPSGDGNTGGQAATEGNTRAERFTEYCNRFMKNVCGENHPGVWIRKDKTGVPYIRFKWRYWKDQKGGEPIEACFDKYQRL